MWKRNTDLTHSTISTFLSNQPPVFPSGRKHISLAFISVANFTSRADSFLIGAYLVNMMGVVKQQNILLVAISFFLNIGILNKVVDT